MANTAVAIIRVSNVVLPWEGGFGSPYLGGPVTGKQRHDWMKPKTGMIMCSRKEAMKNVFAAPNLQEKMMEAFFEMTH